jgi:hypothetical protein
MQTRVTTKEFLAVMYLEAVQNIPLIAGFLAGAWFWHRNALLAAACILVGSILSALSMIPTEGKIFEGHRESVAAIMANIVTFSLLMVVFIAYLEANWSSWWTDIVAGLVAGVALGTARRRSALDLSASWRWGCLVWCLFSSSAGRSRPGRPWSALWS